MRKWIVLPALAFLSLGVLRAEAQALSAEDKAFVDQQIIRVRSEITPLVDPALAMVFAVPFYKIKIITIDDRVGSDNSEYIAVGKHFIKLTAPSTDGDLPNFLKMIDPKFKLAADSDATVVQETLDVIYPTISDDDKKAAKFIHVGNQWMFIRGSSFDSKKGYVFTTNTDGTITGVKYMLKLP